VHVSTTLHRTALLCTAPHHATLHHTAPHQVPPHTTVNNTVSQLSHYISSPLPHSHVAAVAYRCCIRAQALCGSIRCPPGSQGMSWVWAHPSDLRCAEKTPSWLRHMVAFQNEIILPRQARDQHLGKVEIEKEAFLSSAGGRGLRMGGVSAVLDGIH
jgi:hypothetical protein